MPQARRKTPFSGKAKKQQLQTKKNKTFLLSENPSSSQNEVTALNFQPSSRGRGDRNRYALKFYRESDEELKLKKEEAFKALKPVSEDDLEIDPDQYFPEELTFPKRPRWSYAMTTAQLEAQENRYFTEYISSLEKSEHWKSMSYFELNLETWRQLWRVLEMCDILLLVVDVRYAGCMFPPSLYNHVRKCNKHMILVLNKIDLVPAVLVSAWTSYLSDRYPDLKVIYFTSCSGYNLVTGNADKGGLQIRRRKGRQRMCTEGATKLYEACKDIVGDKVDMRSWMKKIREEAEDGPGGFEEPVQAAETVIQKPDTSFYDYSLYLNGILTIGCVGQPNVGKSSLLNAIMGKKVVSVSKTPGHTKHFQTIYLTPRVRLCDCPGLVFPSTVPRAIQILMGSYPIAQLREPYSTIRYLAERLDLPKLLRISHPENDNEWSPTDICAGWAKKRQFLTAKAARLDTYRAGNSLLRMALDGKICLALRPKGYKQNIEKYANSPEIKYIKWVQAIQGDDEKTDGHVSATDSQTEEDCDQSSVSGSDGESSDDEVDSEVTRAMANKFAALASDD